MSEEYFYGVTLTGAGASVVWDPENKEDFPRTNKLIIKQILLGLEAKENEFNVVQAETMSIRETIKIPIAVLKVGESRQSRLDLDFPDTPVIFTLVQGTGPVHIHGQHLSGLLDEELEDIEEMEEEIMDREDGEEEEEEEDEDEGNPKKKLKLSNNAKGKAPVAAKNNKKK